MSFQKFLVHVKEYERIYLKEAIVGVSQKVSIFLLEIV